MSPPSDPYDVFLSYAHEDVGVIAELVALLQRHGWSVWWDRTTAAGNVWSEALEHALGSARCVVVAWSGSSIASRWVRAEALEGLHRGILVPVRLSRCDLPILFRTITTADLSRWPVDPSAVELKRFLSGVRQALSAGTIGDSTTIHHEPLSQRVAQRVVEALGGVSKREDVRQTLESERCIADLATSLLKDPKSAEASFHLCFSALSRLNRATIVVWRTDEQGHFVAARSYGPRTLKQETMQLLASHSAASATEIWTADASMFAREVLDAAGAAWCVRLKGSLHSLFALSSDSAAPARDLVDQLARVSDLLDCVGSSGKSER